MLSELEDLHTEERLVLKIAKTENPITGDLDQEIALLHRLKEEALVASLAVANQERVVIDYMNLFGSKTRKTVAYRATLVTSTYTKYNETGLKKALGAPLWNKVTVSKLDTKKLDEAVADGLVDIMVVAEHSEVLDKKPFIKVTPVQGNNGEE